MSRLTQSIHLCFGLPRFLLPGGTIPQSLSSEYSWARHLTCPNHPNLAFLNLSVMFSTFSLSLMISFLTWFLSVWPHAHLHIFICVSSHFFTWELVIDTVSIPYSNIIYIVLYLLQVMLTPTTYFMGQDYKEKHKLDSKQISNSPC